MNIGRYAPSAQFSVIVVSLMLSGGLVYAAERFTHPPVASPVISADTPAQPSDAAGWEAALYAIQAQNASTSLSAPSPQTVEQMLAAAQSDNVTDTVGKTILINLSNAKSQNLGDDIPTQEQILAIAQAQIEAHASTSLYTLKDLTIVPVSDTSLRAYGNSVVQAFNTYPAASETDTFTILGDAVDTNSEAELQKLAPIKTAYVGLTADLLALPVPRTLAPLHLELVNDFVHITASYDDMQVMLSDPIRGMAGFQTYQNSLAGVGRLFTNIAQDLNKDGILFTKGEPGSAWSAILSP